MCFFRIGFGFSSAAAFCCEYEEPVQGLGSDDLYATIRDKLTKII